MQRSFLLLAMFTLHYLLFLFFLFTGLYSYTHNTLADTHQHDTNTRWQLPALAPHNTSQVSVIWVKQYIFSGNNVINDKTLAEICRPYSQRFVTLNELHSLRQKLIHLYIEKGFINSGVILNKIDNNSVHFNIIEGVLSQFILQGNHLIPTTFIENTLQQHRHILNIYRLQYDLQLLQQQDLIQQINAQLIPGQVLGKSILKLSIQEKSPFYSQFFINNYHSPNIGAEYLGFTTSHKNITQHLDTLTTTFGVSEGLRDVSLYYQYPLAFDSLYISTYWSGAYSSIINDDFKDLDIQSQALTAQINLDYLYYKTLNTKAHFMMGIQYQQNKNFLLDRPFSFSVGVEEGVSKSTLLQLQHQWQQKNSQRSLALHTTLNIGLDWFDANVNDPHADTHFSNFITQAQWLQNLPWQALQFDMTLQLQVSNDTLLPGNKISIGGVQTVRGYRENSFIGDNGIVSSMMLHYSLPYHLQLSPFFDYAKVWDKRNVEATNKDLYSIGINIHWTINNAFSINIDLAKQLRQYEQNKNDLQDSGIHFQLRYHL